jgi:hypothetical protein
MTDLSPAAQAVLDAYMNNCGWLDGPLEKDYRCTAAVLRVAVRINGADAIRQDVLDIAAELENQ